MTPLWPIYVSWWLFKHTARRPFIILYLRNEVRQLCATSAGLNASSAASPIRARIQKLSELRSKEVSFPGTLLFALVKLDLSIFCKKEALALHTSVFWPYSRKQNLFRIKNYPRKLSRLSKIGLLELSGALQRDFFYSKIINILHKQPSSSSHNRFLVILKKGKLV